MIRLAGTPNAFDSAPAERVHLFFFAQDLARMDRPRPSFIR